MKIKIFTQPNCLYCKNVKDALTEKEIEFESIDISQSENREEWNLVTRLSGIGMTPTITFRDQIWAPNRDFQDANSLIQRLQYFLDNPLEAPNEEDRFQILINANKNLAMSLQNIHQLMANIHSKVNQLVPPTPTQTEEENPPQPKKEEKNEETTTS